VKGWVLPVCLNLIVHLIVVCSFWVALSCTGKVDPSPCSPCYTELYISPASQLATAGAASAALTAVNAVSVAVDLGFAMCLLCLNIISCNILSFVIPLLSVALQGHGRVCV
jgi:hypothetical protein